MKRFLFFSLILIAAFPRTTFGQSFAFSTYPQTQCLSGVNTVSGSITGTITGATNYSWMISNPTTTCPASISGVNNNSAFTASFNCCGIYTISLIAYNSTVFPIAVVSNTVQIYCTSPVSITSSADSLCMGQNVLMYAGGGSNYTWQPGGYTGSFVSIPMYTSTNFTVFSTNANGCTQSATKYISVNYAGVVYSQGANICAGQTATLSLSGAASYTWALNGSNASTLAVTPSVSTCYNFTYTGFSGCSSTTAACVYVQPPPGISISGPSVVCSGTTYTLTASGAGNYTWTPSMTTGPTYTMSSPGSTINCVSVYGTSNGCTGSASKCVTVTTLSGVAISGPSVICAGNSATLTASGATNYTWLPGGLTGAAIVVSPSSSTCYTLIGSTGGNCYATAVRCLTVTNSATVTVSQVSVICPGGSATLVASGASSYTWQPGNLTGPGIVVSPLSTTCYTVTGSNGGNCVSSAVRCVTVTNNTNINVQGPTSTCAGNTVALIASGATAYTWMPGGLTGTQVIVSPTVSTCYTVYGYYGGGCNPAAVHCVSVLPQPVISIAGPSVVCAGVSYTLTAGGGISYTWTPSMTTGSVLVVSATSNTVNCVMVYANGTGCAGSASKCVTVNPVGLLPVSGPTAVCPGTPVALTASGAVSYTWMPGGIPFPNIMVSPTVSTCYTVTGTTAQGCLASGLHCITVGSGMISVSGNNMICPGNSATLTASGATSYTWMPGGLTGTTITVSPTVSTCYSVTGASSNCNGSGVYCVSVTSSPAPVISGASVVCQGSWTPLSASGASSYTWLPGGQTTTSITPTFSASTCYTLIGSNGPGCTAATVKCITVAPYPVINATPNQTVCAGQPVTFTLSGSASTYTWWAPTPVVTGSVAVFTPTASNCYSISGVNSAGCMNTIGRCVTVMPASLTVTGNSLVCPGSSVYISVSGAGSYTWFPGGSTSPGIIVTPTANTCYTVSGYNANGCFASAVKCISIGGGSLISISGNNIICAGAGATLTANGASSYTWLPGNQTGSSIVITPTASSCYTVYGNSQGCPGMAVKCVSVQGNQSITVSGGNFCSGTTQTLTASGANSYTWYPFNQTGASVVITPSAGLCYTVVGSSGGTCISSAVNCASVFPTPTITISGNSSSCAGQLVNLLASGAGTYTWSNGAMGPLTNVTPTTSGCYTVTGRNAQGCSSSAVKCVTVIPYPVLGVTGNTSICAGAPALFVASGANYYAWSNGSNTASMSVSPLTNTVYTVTGSNYMCSVTKTININVKPSPVVNAVSGASVICAGASVTLTASGAGSYTWNTGMNTPVVVVSPVVTTAYTVTGQDSSGCKGSAVVLQNVSPCTGLAEIRKTLQQVTLFPNPASEQITFYAGGQKITYFIYDLLGREMAKGEFINSGRVNTASFAAGTYIVRFESDNRQTCQKMVIER